MASWGAFQKGSVALVPSFASWRSYRFCAYSANRSPDSSDNDEKRERAIYRRLFGVYYLRHRVFITISAEVMFLRLSVCVLAG